MSRQPTFCHPILQTSRLPFAHRRNAPLCTTNYPSSQGDQFSQYKARDRRVLAEEAARARAIQVVEKHHHVFLQPAAESLFRAAAARFLAANPNIQVLRTTADPTFGRLRGEPSPPRAVIIEDKPSGAGAWIQGLDRAGKALGPMPSHYVEWGVLGAFGEGTGELVAFEILNADWTDGKKIGMMREKLLKYAEQMVGDGCKRFVALQSPKEPTCFKTVEVWENMDALQKHMEGVDKEFAEDMMNCRAAVNRVRQLYRPMGPT